MTTTTLTLRPIRLEDQPFLYEVYASTRLEELAPLSWSADQQAAFLTQQFNRSTSITRLTIPAPIFRSSF
jgi:hypothetical protein